MTALAHDWQPNLFAETTGDNGEPVQSPVSPPASSAQQPAWPFGDLPPLGFDLIMADPPWHFELYSAKGQGKSADAHYATMDLAAIKALPVSHLARRDAVLFLWATWPLLREAYDVIDAWCFRAVTGGAWAKRTKRGKTAFNTGYRVRNACDPFLIAVTGKPDTSRAERNLIAGLQREHSRKPDEAFRWCERYLPGAARVELFSRESRPGWSAWGYETGKFDMHANGEGKGR
jgi:N6-adenosine-specific RNA methylase IME4